MRSNKSSDPAPTLIAFLFSDINDHPQVLHLSPDYRVEAAGSDRFVLHRRGFTLPARFFGDAISSITALIGKNSSGKSTALADIARILCGNRTITSGCSLILEQGGRVFQLQQGWDMMVEFDKAEIPVQDSGDIENLKLVYFSSSYDPLQRKQALLEPASPVHLVDISSQFVYNRDGRRSDDFSEKLLYLQTIFEDGLEPLELKPEDKRARSISFTARIAYDPNDSGRDFLKMLLEALPGSNPLEHLKEVLHAALNMPVSEFQREVALLRTAPGATKSTLWNRQVNYFSILRDFFQQRFGQSRWVADPVVFLLVIGQLIQFVADDRRRKRPHQTIAKIPRLFDEGDAFLGELLGEQFISCAEIVADHAMAGRQWEPAHIVVSVRSQSPGEGQARPGNDDGSRILLDAFIALRQMGTEFDIDFNGLSDGQRSLLSFAARYFSQEHEHAWKGNTLLLIDEHEQGLHPEWQRRFIKQLCELISARSRTAGQTQVVLSSHSPFVVSDLPSSCVSIVGGHAAAEEPTFGGNLLELLLSPLFMDRTTGEFAAEKVKGWLDSIKRTRNLDKLAKMEDLIDLVGDTLMRNYLHLAWRERMAWLKRQTGRARHD